MDTQTLKTFWDIPHTASAGAVEDCAIISYIVARGMLIRRAGREAEGGLAREYWQILLPQLMSIEIAYRVATELMGPIGSQLQDCDMIKTLRFYLE
jgi:hypothetical protein